MKTEIYIWRSEYDRDTFCFGYKVAGRNDYFLAFILYVDMVHDLFGKEFCEVVKCLAKGDVMKTTLRLDYLPERI